MGVCPLRRRLEVVVGGALARLSCCARRFCQGGVRHIGRCRGIQTLFDHRADLASVQADVFERAVIERVQRTVIGALLARADDRLYERAAGVDRGPEAPVNHVR